MTEKKWYFRYSEGTSVVSTEAALRCFTEYPQIPECLRNIIFANKRGLLTCYVSREEDGQVRNEGKLFFEREYRRNFESGIHNRAERSAAFYCDFQKIDVTRADNETLAKLSDEWADHLAEMTSYYKVAGGRVYPVLEEEIKRVVAQHYSGKELDTKYSTLLTATEIDILEREDIELRRIAAEGDISEERLRRHAKKYSAKYILVYDEGKIFDSLREKIEILKKDGKTAVGEEHEIRERKRKLRVEQERIEAVIGDQNIIDVARFLRDQGRLRFDYKEWFMVEYKFLELFREIAHRIGIGLEELMMTYRTGDIRTFLSSGNALSDAERKNRLHYYVFVQIDGKRDFLSGVKAETFTLELLGVGANVSELKGVVASRGKVRGNARVILPRDFAQIEEDLKHFQQGEILVTTMTQPSIISAMKKAAAIVTDQGGMTSHAAVLAREFCIPCIVGTMTATQVFKTGDEIEVDAERGIVTLLNKPTEGELIPNFVQRPFHFEWANIQTLHTLENNLLSLVNYRDNRWNYTKNVVEFSRAGMIQTYHADEELPIGEEMGKMFLDAKKWKAFVKEMEAEIEHTWKHYRRIRNVNIPKLSNEDLFKLFALAQENWQRVIGYFRTQDEKATKALCGELKKFVTGDEFTTLLLSHELDLANREVMDWSKLLQEPPSDRALLDHAFTYPWVVAMHFTYEAVIETLQKRYEFDKKHAKAPYKAEEKRELTKKHEGLYKKYPKIQPYAERLQRLSLSRMEIKAAWSSIDFYMIPIMNEIVSRTGESLQDLNMHYRASEIQDLLSSGVRLSSDLKKKRQKCFTAILYEGTAYFFEGDDGEKAIQMVLGKEYDKKEREKAVKGFVAYPGVVTGTVRILHANDVEGSRKMRTAFQKGEILVTEMTQPNIMDIAARAGAIVTDEGSLLSHAAIVAREFKIPCIVGTNNATKTLQDGDMVEVDANNGTVRILK